MTHALLAHPTDTVLAGLLAYIREDHAFDFRPLDPDGLTRAAGGKGTTSLLVGSLQIEVGVETGRFLYVWGYHPMETWKEAEVLIPQAQPGQISTASLDLKPGVSEALVEVGEWSTVLDPATGWVQLGSDQPLEPESAIEFAQDVVAGVSEDRLLGLWLRPSFE
ncbi:MAG: hypothetical protein ACRDK3_05050 [Actinomycetota bacterium]